MRTHRPWPVEWNPVSELLYVLPALACAVGMGVMMWVMMRKPKGAAAPTEPAQSQGYAELAALRVAVAQMRDAAGQAAEKPSVSSGPER